MDKRKHQFFLHIQSVCSLFSRSIYIFRLAVLAAKSALNSFTMEIIHVQSQNSGTTLGYSPLQSSPFLFGRPRPKYPMRLFCFFFFLSRVVALIRRSFSVLHTTMSLSKSKQEKNKNNTQE